MNKKTDYIPVLQFNKEDLFVRNFDKPYWIPVDKVSIEKILINKVLFNYNNAVSESLVNNIIRNFDLTFWIPITLNNDYYLLDGQHRLEVAKRMNLKYIDVIIQDTELLTSNSSTKIYRSNKFIL
jgi:hypothetical protein